jgi:hypothetical protein
MFNNLSQIAQEALKNAKINKSTQNYSEIVSKIKEKNLPVYEALVKFELEYGGINFIDEYDLWFRCYEKIHIINGNEYFECGDNYFASPEIYLLDKEGKMYYWVLDSEIEPELIAESVLKFIEDHALSYFLTRNKLWKYNYKIKENEFLSYLENGKFQRLEYASTKGVTEWWLNFEENIYLKWHKYSIKNKEKELLSIYLKQS